MLGTRVLTAVVLIPVLVAFVLYGKGWPFVLFVGAAALLCAAEYFRMFFASRRDRWSGTAVTGILYLCGAVLPFPLAAAAVLFCAVVAAFHFLVHAADPAERARLSALAGLGTVYIGGLFSCYPRILSLPRGEHWVLMGIVTVAAGDTFAYITGRAVGKRPLAPAISPNKTVEGALGGLLASVVLATLYASAFLPQVPVRFIVPAVAVVGAVGQCGDLFESLLKRAAGVKDSGTILPGHGGMFDRADGLLAAGPALYLLAAVSPLAGGPG